MTNVLEVISLRQFLAMHAPMPSDSRMNSENTRDHNLNPHNDYYKPKLRSQLEIEACLRYEWADAMIKMESYKQ